MKRAEPIVIFCKIYKKNRIENKIKYFFFGFVSMYMRVKSSCPNLIKENKTNEKLNKSSNLSNTSSSCSGS